MNDKKGFNIKRKGLISHENLDFRNEGVLTGENNVYADIIDKLCRLIRDIARDNREAR